MDENNLRLNKNNISYGMQSSTDNNVPMQAGIDMETLKSGTDNSYLAKRVKQSEANSNLLPAATLLTWYGLSQGMDIFNKKCNLEYENTPMGKFGALGDKLVNKIKGSKIAQSNLGQKISKACKSSAAAVNNFLNRSAMVRAFRYTPSEPTNKMVVSQANGLLGWLAQDTEQIFEGFIKPAKNVSDLEQYGADKKFIQILKKAMSKPGANREVLLRTAEMKILGFSPKEIKKYIKGGKIIDIDGLYKLLRNTKIGNLGLTPQDYEIVSKDFLKNSDKVIKGLEKAAKNNGHMFAYRMKREGFFSKITNHLFGRKVGLRELYNKYLVTTGAKNPKHTSKLGKLMAKGLGLFMEGTTNRFAGGKLAVFMQAYIFGDMIINTLKAPKGEKGKTLAERFTNDFAYFICMPFGVQLMHKFGGLQYTGLSKAQVAKYRQELSVLNEEVLKGTLTKSDYDYRVRSLKGTLRSGRKNIFSKILGRAAEIMDVGLEQIRPFSKKAVKPGILGKIKDFFSHPKYYLKNAAGYPIRLWVVLGLLMPLLAKGATKTAHMIFGRPTHSVLDDEDETANSEKEQQQMVELLKQIEAEKREQSIVPASPSNLINQYMTGQRQTMMPQQTVQPDYNSQNSGYVPSPESTISNNNQSAPVRTYVPNPTPVQLPQEDTTKADMALMRADAAEKLARETLSMQ